MPKRLRKRAKNEDAAQAAGIASHVWSIGGLVGGLDAVDIKAA